MGRSGSTTSSSTCASHSSLLPMDLPSVCCPPRDETGDDHAQQAFVVVIEYFMAVDGEATFGLGGIAFFKGRLFEAQPIARAYGPHKPDVPLKRTQKDRGAPLPYVVHHFVPKADRIAAAGNKLSVGGAFGSLDVDVKREWIKLLRVGNHGLFVRRDFIAPFNMADFHIFEIDRFRHPFSPLDPRSQFIESGNGGSRFLIGAHSNPKTPPQRFLALIVNAL